MNVSRVCRDLPDVPGLDADQDVFGFDVGVDDFALRVKVVEALENLKFDKRWFLVLSTSHLCTDLNTNNFHLLNKNVKNLIS